MSYCGEKNILNNPGITQATRSCSWLYTVAAKPDMRIVEILPQTDFWGIEISSKYRDSRPIKEHKISLYNVKHM